MLRKKIQRCCAFEGELIHIMDWPLPERLAPHPSAILGNWHRCRQPVTRTSNVTTTMNIYVKIVSVDAANAMKNLETAEVYVVAKLHFLVIRNGRLSRIKGLTVRLPCAI